MYGTYFLCTKITFKAVCPMDSHTLLTSYLANLKVDLIVADYNECSTDWRDLDYTPDYSKFYYIIGGRLAEDRG